MLAGLTLAGLTLAEPSRTLGHCLNRRNTERALRSVVLSAAAAMVETAMDSTAAEKTKADSKPAEVETTVPVRLRPKKLSLSSEGRQGARQLLPNAPITRQGQGCGRLTWHTSSRRSGGGGNYSPAARLGWIALVVLVARGPGCRGACSACRQCRWPVIESRSVSV
jgi:hypothetical protein